MAIFIDDSLKLEMISIEHAESIFNLINQNKVHLREWLPWVIKMETIEQLKEIILISQQGFTDNSDHAFVIKYEEKIAGRIGVYDIDHQNKIGSIGYWIGEKFQGKGIVTKSCIAIIEYCFHHLDLNRLEIKCAVKNYKSQAIAEKLHFTKEGVLREAELLHTEFIDLFSYSLLKKEWKTVQF